MGGRGGALTPQAAEKITNKRLIAKRMARTLAQARAQRYLSRDQNEHSNLGQC